MWNGGRGATLGKCTHQKSVKAGVGWLSGEWVGGGVADNGLWDSFTEEEGETTTGAAQRPRHGGR